MKRELGDICWYLAQACMALDTTFDEVIEMNVEKLESRYPGGSFENRKEGDLTVIKDYVHHSDETLYSRR